MIDSDHDSVRTQASVGVDLSPKLAWEVGDKIGRYIIVGRVGTGAMGSVYRAFDEMLNRPVALKVVRDNKSAADSGSQDGRLDIVREARAAAKLSHPNVVSIYDVGVHGEEIFISMELVEGEDLRRWLVKERTWPQILDAFLQAGEGLAAAHRAGIVHRDFKPANVHMGSDGRPRVLDFGLAVPYGSSGSEGDSGERESDTTAYEVAGTPAFMAPEQHAATEVDARADQYAFCVVLYIALYGERPYRKRPGQTLSQAKRAGPPELADTRKAPLRKGPLWLRDILLRGLSWDRADRFPRMEDLLAALRNDPAVRRRRRLVLAGVGALVLIAAGSVWVAYRERALRQEQCLGAETAMGKLWDEARRSELEATFNASGLSYADRIFTSAAEEIDEFVLSWQDQHRAACEATRVRGEQSEALLDLRVRCLRQGESELKATLDLLDEGDPASIEHALESVAALADPRECADVDRLMAAVSLPTDLETLAILDDVDTMLANANALERSGHYARALVRAQEAVERARATKYAPTVGRALLELAGAQRLQGDYEASERNVREALVGAVDGQDDMLLVKAWMELAELIGHKQRRPSEGIAYSDAAELAMRRIGHQDALLGDLWTIRARFLISAGEVAPAKELLDKVLNIRKAEYGDEHINVALLYVLQGNASERQGDPRAALKFHQKARRLYERLLGAQHPATALAQLDEGRLWMGLGEFEPGHAAMSESREKLKAALGPEHVAVGTATANFASALTRMGRLKEALPMAEEAVRMMELNYHAHHPFVARALGNVGIIYSYQARWDDARRVYERSLAITQSSDTRDYTVEVDTLVNLGNVFLMSDDPATAQSIYERALQRLTEHGSADNLTATPMVNLAEAYERQGDFERAVVLYERGLAAFARWLGADNANYAAATLGYARTLLAVEREEDAGVVLVKSIALVQRVDGDPVVLAELRGLLGQALWETEPVRARKLVSDALTELRAAGARATQGVRQLEGFLSAVSSAAQ